MSSVMMLLLLLEYYVLIISILKSKRKWYSCILITVLVGIACFINDYSISYIDFLIPPLLLLFAKLDKNKTEKMIFLQLNISMLIFFFVSFLVLEYK